MNGNKIFIALSVLAALLLFFWILPVEDKRSVITQQLKKEVKNKKIIELRLGHNTQENSTLHQASLRFAKEIIQKSHGDVRINVYPSQQLGNDHQMLEMARKGELDILLTPTAKMSLPVPAMQYADLPFLFPSRDDAYKLLDGEPGQMLLAKLREIDLVGVTFWENGFKYLSGNQPFLAPEDFVNKKKDFMESHIIMEQFKAFNAEPVPIDFHATRQVLEDRVVDGQENPLIALVSMGFDQVQSILVLSEHAYLSYVFSISKKTLKKLPPEIGQILIETAQQQTQWEREETQQREKKLLEKIKKSGVAIHRLTLEERQKFARKTAHIAETYEEIIGSDILSKTQELLLNKYGPAAESKLQIVIGINTDLSLDGKTVGLAIKRGAKLAAKDINANGGVLGKPLVILARDHRVSPGKSQKNVQSFIERDDVVAIFGGLHSAIVLDDIETVQQAQIPYLIPWATSSLITNNGYQDNYLFRLSLDDSKASIMLANEALARFKHPAILVENSIWGRSNLEQMKKHLTNSGIKPVTALTYNRGQKSFNKELLQIDASGADVILMVANSKEGAIIIQQLAESPYPQAIISHWGIQGGTFFEDTRDVLAKIDLQFIQSFSFNARKHLKSDELKAAYMQNYAKTSVKDIKAHPGVAQAYDLVQILAMAIEQAGTIDRKAIKIALENLPAYDGVVKRYNPVFTTANHEALNESDFFMARYDFDGKVIPISLIK